MSLSSILLGLSLLGPAMAAPADTVKAPKPKPEAPAPAPAPAPPPKPARKIEPRTDPTIKPLPLGEPKLKRRKFPD